MPRMINGKRYYSDTELYYTKEAAKKRAEYYRKKGYLARVLQVEAKVDEVFVVFYHIPK